MLIDISKYRFKSDSNIIHINVVPGTPFISGKDTYEKDKYYICLKFPTPTSITTYSEEYFHALVKLLSYASQYTEHEIRQHHPELLI